jgi:hypothetical protein
MTYASTSYTVYVVSAFIEPLVVRHFRPAR